MKKKILSIALALAMCLSLAIPTLAADQKLYFEMTHSEDYSSISLVEADGPSDNAGPYSISGTDLRQIGTVVYPEFGESEYQFTVPVYTSKTPVTVILGDGVERGVPVVDEPGTTSVPLGSAQVDLVSYDTANKTYNVLKEHVLFFDGYFSFQNQSGKVEDVSIKEYYTAEIWDRMEDVYGICRGATATLSAPGTYRIEASYWGVEGSYEVFVTITDDGAGNPMPSAVSFTDVAPTAYYAEAVKWAVEKNITSGTSANTFSPNATCNRAQILTFLWRANGSPELSAANPFTDIKTSDYFYKAALWAVEKGMVSGSTFGANTDCTRAMTVEYMWKAAGSPATADKANFNDVPANANYAQAVAWAVEQKITSGTGKNTFSPSSTCTRGQIVTFLYRALGQ